MIELVEVSESRREQVMEGIVVSPVGVKFEDGGFELTDALVKTRELVLPVGGEGLEAGMVCTHDAQLVQQHVVLLDLPRQLARQLPNHLVPRSLLLRPLVFL